MCKDRFLRTYKTIATLIDTISHEEGRRGEGGGGLGAFETTF